MAVASLYLGLSPLAAQQTKGNIVEYFGKERVERVDEGMILHTFRQGYFLPVTAPSGNKLRTDPRSRAMDSYRGRLYRKVRQPCFTPCLCFYGI